MSKKLKGQCYKPISELTPEQLAARREKGRRDAARLRARRSEEINACRRQKYVEDRDHREKLKESARKYYSQNKKRANRLRYIRKCHKSMSQLHSWGQFDVKVDNFYEYHEAMEWYERWFASLDDPILEVW